MAIEADLTRLVIKSYVADNGLDLAAIRRAHRFTWTEKGYRAWDATCSCGYYTGTGGAIRARVEDYAADHIWDMVYQAVNGTEAEQGERIEACQALAGALRSLR